MINPFRTLIASASKPVNISGSHLRVQLADADLDPPHAQCPACGSDTPPFKQVMVHAGPEVWFARCPACGSSSATRMPGRAFLESYYAGYFDDAGHKVSFQDYERFYKHMARLGLFDNAQADE